MHRCGLAIQLGLVACTISFYDTALTVFAGCPNSCSQRGLCSGPGDDAFCICEMGYQGDDCATRLCPKGDDPLTTGQSDRALMLRTTAVAGVLDGKVKVSFQGESVSFDANAHSAGEDGCVLAFQAMPNLESVSCTRGDVSEAGGAEYLLSILSFPTFPFENNIYAHSGNPPLEDFACEIIPSGDQDGEASALSPSCELFDVVTENVKEYVECSGHGKCIRETGRCECQLGFKGDACDDIVDAEDVQVILAEGPFFTGAALKLRANRGRSEHFDLLKAVAGSHEVMTLTGTGDLILHEGSLFVKSSAADGPPGGVWDQSAPADALVVSGGSLGVHGGGAGISYNRANGSALLVTVGARMDDVEPDGSGALWPADRKDYVPYTGIALAVNVPEAASERFRLLELSAGRSDSAGAESVFSVRGDGRVSLSGGGGVLLEEGDLEVSKGRAVFKGNVSVGQSLVIERGSVDVVSGVLRVSDGVLDAHPPSSQGHGRTSTERRALALLSASLDGFPGDILHVDARGHQATEPGAVLIRASAGGEDVFELKATGSTVIKAGGLDVQAGGVRVGSGGLEIQSGGLAVDGGIRLRSGTLTIDDSGLDDATSGVEGVQTFGLGEGRHARDGGKVGGFEVSNGGIRTFSRDTSTPALSATADAEGFGGAVLSVAAPASAASPSFRLLQGIVAANDESALDTTDTFGTEEEEVFVVDGTGRLTAAGGLRTGLGGDVIVGGGFRSSGSTVLERHRAPARSSGVEAGEHLVEVDVGVGTFFEVPEHGNAGPGNVIRLLGEAVPGQLLIVRNADDKPTRGELVVPAGYTVMYIFDGGAWQDLRVLEASATELRGVKSISAANDLDIGEVTLKAQQLVSSGNPAGRVAVYGGGGLLTSGKGLLWDGGTGTLTVPRLRASEVTDGIDFKGKPARNVALLNATIDFVPFIESGRFVLESAKATENTVGATSGEGGAGAAALAIFDHRGELHRAGSGVRLLSGGVMEVTSLGAHAQAGDVDFQGNEARNLSLSDVSALTGLERLELGRLYIPPLSRARSSPTNAQPEVGGDAIVVLSADGEVRPAGEEFAVDLETGTLRIPKIGSHAITGDVDYGGNMLTGATLESPDVRGTIPRMHVEELSVSARPSISKGFLAVFSSEHEGAAAGGGGKSLGQASGGGGLAWRDGAVQDLRLGGTTVLEGDLDVAGYRLLNFNADSPVADELEELTIRGALRLEAHASSKASVLSVGAKGEVIPADPASLALAVASLSASGLVEARELACRGTAEIEGKLAVGGGLSLGGELELGGGIDARGTRITNAYFGNASFRDPVLGDVAVEGTLKVGALDRRKVSGDKGAPSGETVHDPATESSMMVSHLAPVVTAGMGGELGVARGLKYDEDADLFVVPKISGHEVTGPVDFAGQRLSSPQVDFSSGGGIDGLGSLSVGGDGLDVGGPLRAGSDVIVDGSVTVTGAVMGRGPYMDSSDLRLKTDVTSIPGRDASDIVRALRGVTYALDVDAAAPSARRGVSRGRQYGFIAQEVEDVIPEIVSEDTRGFKVVAYARLVPVLTTALSLAYDRLDTVERNVAVSASTVNKARVASGSSHEMEEPCSATRLARSKRPEYAENAITRVGKALGIFRRGCKGWGSEEVDGRVDDLGPPPDVAQGAVVYGKRSELKAGDVPLHEEAGCDDVVERRRLARDNVELHDMVDALRKRLHELEMRIEALEIRRGMVAA